MRIAALTSIYSLIIGLSMTTIWSIFLITRQGPELLPESAHIIMHLAAEFTTAFALLIGAYGLLATKSWGVRFNQFSSGMLMYTLIVSLGYYLQSGDFTMVGMFGTMLIMTLFVLLLTYLRDEEFS